MWCSNALALNVRCSRDQLACARDIHMRSLNVVPVQAMSICLIRGCARRGHADRMSSTRRKFTFLNIFCTFLGLITASARRREARTHAGGRLIKETGNECDIILSDTCYLWLTNVNTSTSRGIFVLSIVLLASDIFERDKIRLPERCPDENSSLSSDLSFHVHTGENLSSASMLCHLEVRLRGKPKTKVSDHTDWSEDCVMEGKNATDMRKQIPIAKHRWCLHEYKRSFRLFCSNQLNIGQSETQNGHDGQGYDILP